MSLIMMAALSTQSSKWATRETRGRERGERISLLTRRSRSPLLPSDADDDDDRTIVMRISLCRFPVGGGSPSSLPPKNISIIFIRCPGSLSLCMPISHAVQTYTRPHGHEETERGIWHRCSFFWLLRVGPPFTHKYICLWLLPTNNCSAHTDTCSHSLPACVSVSYDY